MTDLPGRTATPQPANDYGEQDSTAWYEYGVQRPDGTIAVMWLGEARDLAPKWGGTVVQRLVQPGPWQDVTP